MLWKEIGWNGIRFKAPASWETGKIGKQYLVFKEKGNIVMEIKWEQVKGEFTHESQLNLLQTSFGEVYEKFAKCRHPQGWKNALGDYETTCFTWKNQTRKGTGTIVYCSECETATLIKFFKSTYPKPREVYLKILASFHDHSGVEPVLWSIFDIRAMIPKDFELVQYKFLTGEFALTFKSEKHKITLYRWGPASDLLNELDLFRFAGAHADLANGKTDLSIIADKETLDWQTKPPFTQPSWWWQRIKRKTPASRLRIWHLRESNKIFGAGADGKTLIEPEIFDSICNRYESIS